MNNEQVPNFNIPVYFEDDAQIFTINPMKLPPVISCVLTFLSFEEIKTVRFVYSEWGSAGAVALASRSLISFRKLSKDYPDRLPHTPVDFQSCFLDSTFLFSAFKVSGPLIEDCCTGKEPWTIEELTKFFAQQQKYIKKLILQIECSKVKTEEKVKVSSWILGSKMVKSDAKYLTKLSIEDFHGHLDILPLNLIAHIKDLSLSFCKINVEPGIQIFSIKLKLAELKFYQNGVKLGRILINDIVNFRNAKEVALHSAHFRSSSKFVLDLWGNNTLDQLTIDSCEIRNGETSNWIIDYLSTINIPYPMNRQMKIKELYIAHVNGITDLFELPASIQKITFHNAGTINCSQPIELENLEYLHIANNNEDFINMQFLSHFMNCPTLTHLKINGYTETELTSLWMPKTVKTLTLENSSIKLHEERLEIRKIICDNRKTFSLSEFSVSHIKVEILVLFCPPNMSEKRLAHFLEYKKNLNFCTDLYIGEYNWGEKDIVSSGLIKYVDTKSAYYVFEQNKKGRALSKEAFFEVVPNHVDFFP